MSREADVLEWLRQERLLLDGLEVECMGSLSSERLLYWVRLLRDRVTALELANAPPPEEPPPVPDPPAARSLKFSLLQDHSNPQDLEGAVLQSDQNYWIWLAVDSDATVDEVDFDLDDVAVNTVTTANAALEWWYAGEAASGGSTPTVAATNTSGESAIVFSHDISLPTGLATNDLMLVWFVFKGDPGVVTWPANWIQVTSMLDPSGTAAYVEVRAKRWSAESGTIVVTTANQARSAHNAYRIAGAADPAVTPPEASIFSDNTDLPNPPALTPSGGSRNYLWICGGGHSKESTTAAPTNYTNFLSINTSEGTSNHMTCYTARRALTASTEDPGSFAALATSRVCVRATVAVYPVASGSGGHQSADFTPGDHFIDADVTVL